MSKYVQIRADILKGMKLTKFEHSCVVLEKDGQYLVIDPGGLSGSFSSPENCVGVVVTHEHFDHLDQAKLADVQAKNPQMKLFVNDEISKQLTDELKKSVVVVAPGQTETIESFKLEFVGGVHEVVRPEITPCVNTGVIVDDLFYQPGDAHFVPEKPTVWLGIPINAPWSKVSETNDFVKAVKAKNAIPIHDGLLNPEGIPTYESHITAACEMVGTQYHPITVGDTIELAW